MQCIIIALKGRMGILSPVLHGINTALRNRMGQISTSMHGVITALDRRAGMLSVDMHCFIFVLQRRNGRLSMSMHCTITALQSKRVSKSDRTLHGDLILECPEPAGANKLLNRFPRRVKCTVAPSGAGETVLEEHSRNCYHREVSICIIREAATDLNKTAVSHDLCPFICRNLCDCN